MVFVVVWLAVNIILPLVILSLPIGFAICSLSVSKWRRHFSYASIIGVIIMLWDISVGGLSANLVNNVLKDPVWITGFVYFGTASVALSLYFLCLPLVQYAQQIAKADQAKGMAFMVGIIVCCLLCVSLIPLQYHGVLREILT